MRLLLLVYEFFKIGLFSIGGGLATLPFLYQLADKYDWFSYEMIMDMVAISEATPGPIGVNMATYVGFQYAGIFGGIIATTALVFPSVVIIIWISKFLEKFKDNKYVKDVFYLLRPTVTGLIAFAGFGVIVSAIFGVDGIGMLTQDKFLSGIVSKEMLLFVVLLFLTNKFPKHPIVYIALGGVVGVLFAF